VLLLTTTYDPIKLWLGIGLQRYANRRKDGQDQSDVSESTAYLARTLIGGKDTTCLCKSGVQPSCCRQAADMCRYAKVLCRRTPPRRGHVPPVPEDCLPKVLVALSACRRIREDTGALPLVY